jgi:uncharacterized membrane protein
MKHIVTTLIRVLISIFLVYKVYGETGIYTAICMGLIFLTFELSSYVLKMITKNLKTIVKQMKEGKK